ncbi:polysaccharide deacetylase family protein [Dongia deserti]|uniref:polysaccharide deacetylase family protein n=1 Tax=Dongia deserti TaxID=2268030 RepID=UPI000E65206B|nr:polysaccharide deacetylase family protein [Dongia deserti]
MSGWQALARECAAWEAGGRRIELWWRDDDAVADTPSLRRLLAIARVPLSLAVIPATLEPSLPALLQGHSSVSVLQHGFDHTNRAPAGVKKSEFPPTRPWAEVAGDLAKGRDRLATAFGAQFVPALTPPWNRIDAGHGARLGELGYRGLTTYLGRKAGQTGDLIQVNTHVDVIDWHGSRGFLGLAATLDLLVQHLAAKRLGTADPGEPTGLLTHHLVHDTETWEFLGALLDWCAKKPTINWRRAADLFPESGRE